MAKQLFANHFQTAAIIVVALIGLSLVTSTTGFGIGFDETVDRGTATAPIAEVTGNAACVTTDGDSNIHVNGFCTDSDSSERETCVGANAVEESYCTYNSCTNIIITCPLGTTCTSGACV